MPSFILQPTANARCQSALDVYRAMKKTNPDPSGNLVYSPYCFQQALGLLERGARGKTAGILEAHRLAAPNYHSQPAPSGVTIKPANGLWVRNGITIEDAFSSDAQTRFGAHIENADFGGNTETVRANINRWISQATQGLVPDLVPPNSFDATTFMILASALYTKGLWVLPFNQAMTAQTTFNLSDGSNIQHPLMTLQKPKFPVLQDAANGVDVIHLPIGERPPIRAGSPPELSSNYETALLIALPRNDQSVDQLENQLTADTLLNWIQNPRAQSISKILIPKFKLVSQQSLMGVLEMMGVQEDLCHNPDFSGINTEYPLSIRAMMHGAQISLDEDGIEAGTATQITQYFSGSSGLFFEATRPFWFALVDLRNQTPLFMGRLMNPAA